MLSACILRICLFCEDFDYLAEAGVAYTLRAMRRIYSQEYYEIFTTRIQTVRKRVRKVLNSEASYEIGSKSVSHRVTFDFATHQIHDSWH